MRKKHLENDEYDVTIYEPLNSKFRENMYMKRVRGEGERDPDPYRSREKSRRQISVRRKKQLQPWPF